MEQDRNVLLKIISRYFPYGLKCEFRYNIKSQKDGIEQNTPISAIGTVQCVAFDAVQIGLYWLFLNEVKLFLRPFSSITQQEIQELKDNDINIIITSPPSIYSSKYINIADNLFFTEWCHKHMFDCYNLLNGGKALRMPRKQEVDLLNTLYKE